MDNEPIEMEEFGRSDSDQSPPSPSVSRDFESLLQHGIQSPDVQRHGISHTGKKDVSVSFDQHFLWLPSSKGMGSHYTSRIDKMKQMDLKPNVFVYYMYTPIGASIFSISLGSFLIILSLFLFFFSSTVKVEIPYTEDDTGPLTVKLGKEFKPPIYIYYKLTDFYVTHKRVVYDSDPSLVPKSKCKSFKTFEEILDLRCINGKNTLNGKDEWCKDYKDNQKFKLPVYPCGPLAATIMTDNIEICPNEVPRNDEGNYDEVDFAGCLNILVQDQSDLWKFASFNVKKRRLDGFCWMDLSNPLYHTWMLHPYTNTFLKPYGVIYDDVPEGEYKIHLVNNLWPATSWQAKKAIYITCVNVLGSKSLPLEIMLLCITPWRGLDKVTVGIVTEKEEFIRRSSTSDMEMGSIEVPPGPGLCLCPLHSIPETPGEQSTVEQSSPVEST